jgi:7,8-dihydropterin-6-yl-methyl-4-(beta-D-ribofuranosyl)aminobenzene 5'-phosphate synthase
LPVQRGTARNGSRTDLFLGNGDVLEVTADI